MRGALVSRLDHAVQNGIIPADAGSTHMDRVISAYIRDHPRGCGEHTEMLNAINWQRGSSPRMRGAL